LPRQRHLRHAVSMPAAHGCCRGSSTCMATGSRRSCSRAPACTSPTRSPLPKPTGRCFRTASPPRFTR